MTDHLSWESLNDLVDGLLAPSAAAAAEAHARSCNPCGAALAELRATVELAHDLPSAVPVPGDLWRDVRETIEANKVARFPAPATAPASRGWWVTPRRLGIAAAAVIMVSASLTGLALEAFRQGEVTPGQVSSVPPLSLSWQVSERAFQASVLELREQLQSLHGHLSPETHVKVEAALATIDLAIAEGREALLRDPANAALSELLASNYRQKIELLRRATQLASST